MKEWKFKKSDKAQIYSTIYLVGFFIVGDVALKVLLAMLCLSYALEFLYFRSEEKQHISVGEHE